jgi:hypothetical protein
MDRVLNFLHLGNETSSIEEDSFSRSNLPPQWIPTQNITNKKMMERELLQKIKGEPLSFDEQPPTSILAQNLKEKSQLRRSMDDKIENKSSIHKELKGARQKLHHVELPLNNQLQSQLEILSPSLQSEQFRLQADSFDVEKGSAFLSDLKEENIDSSTLNIEIPTVVHEHIHPYTREVVQPVIFRDREQTEIQQVIKNLHETQIQPTLFISKDLPAETREVVYQEDKGIRQNLALPSVEVDSTVYEKEIMEPIIQETIHKRIVREIQPVVERDVIQTTIIKENLPIYEKIVEAPRVTTEILPMRESKFMEKNSEITVEKLEREGLNSPMALKSQ